MKAKKKLTRLWSILLVLVMVMELLPTTVLAAVPTAPDVDGNTIYANGFPILIEAGETSGTTVKYDSDKTAPYDYETVLIENNGNALTVYAGGNAKRIDSASILMTGGSISTIYGGGYCYGEYTKVGSVEITINGGAVGTIYGGGYARYYDYTGGVSDVVTATITVTGGTVGTLCASSAYPGRESSSTVTSTSISVTGGTISNIKENAGKPNNAVGNTVTVSSFVITGGSIASSTISLTPTNGETTNVSKNELTLKDKDEANTVPNEPLSALTTDAGYTYGMNDVKTDTNGKIYVWLPEDTSISGVESASGDEYEAGSTAGVLKLKDVIVALKIKGNYIHRTNATNATLRFYSEGAGTYYYVVNNSSVVPSASEVKEASSGVYGSGSVVAGTNSINLTELSSGKQYAYVVVDNGELSNVLAFEMPYNVYYFDGFESYQINTSISSGALSPISQVHSGTGDADQKVIERTDEGNCLSLSSTSGWASDQIVSWSGMVPTSGMYVFEGDVMPQHSSSETNNWILRFTMTNGTYGISYNEMGVHFKEGKILEAITEKIGIKDSFEKNTWYHIKIKAYPESGLCFIYVNGDEFGAYTVPRGINRIAISAGHNYTAYYDNLKYYVDLDASPMFTTKVNNGTADPSTAVTEGTKVTITAGEAPSGKVFDKWVVNAGGITLAEVTASPTTFTMGTANVEVTATYKDPLYTTTVNNGTATPSTAVVAGTEVKIAAGEAPSGKEFDKWVVNAGGITLADVTASPTTFTMGTANVEVTAMYKDLLYTTKVNSGTADPSTAVVAGTEVKITAGEAPSGKEFDKWVVNAGGITLADVTASPTTFTMGTANVEVTAMYKDLLYTTKVNNGTADPSTAVKEGTEVTITANAPEAGKEFEKWEVNAGGITLAKATASETTFTMGTTNVEVTAKYKDIVVSPTMYTVSFNSNGGSTVENQTVVSGETATKPTDPSRSGYNFKEWQKDGVKFDFSTPITEDTELTAVWTAKSSGGSSSSVTKYEITVTAGKGGTISPETTKVGKGDNQKFTIKANDGYEIEDVLVDGKSVGAVESYKFEKVSAKHTIKATFKEIEKVEEKEEVKNNEENTTSWENPFEDVTEDDWYYNAVEFVNSKGLFSGMNKDEFGSKVSMTRGMFVTVLSRLNGGEIDGEVDFTDVDENAYYAKPIAWAYVKGIVNGVGNNMFAPNMSITREELAVMMYNYMLKEGIDKSASLVEFPEFVDAEEISSWAKNAVNVMRATGLMSGKPGNKFDPKGTATRAEVATILMNFCKQDIK